MVYRNKFAWISGFVRDKTILDLGCVCHDLNQTAVPWLHGFLRSLAARVVGVDCLADEVERMRRDGCEAVCANVEEMDLGEEFEGAFDVVVAGDIIEHLGNVRGFLERAKVYLKPAGLLLITTPNPITPVRLLRILLKGRAGANRQHTCWFTARVLRQLAERCGLESAGEAYVDDTRLFYPWLKPVPGGAVRRSFRRAGRLAAMLLIWQPAVLVQSLLCRLRPRLAETICLAFRLKDENA